MAALGSLIRQDAPSRTWWLVVKEPLPWSRWIRASSRSSADSVRIMPPSPLVVTLVG